MINLNALYFVLFLLLITGGTAAMAKNDYGIQLMAWTFVGYAAISLLAGIQAALDRRKPAILTTEYFLLVIVFGIISMRIMVIRFPYIELLFSSAGLALVMVYVKNIIDLRSGFGNKPLTRFLMMFYGSVVLYLIAMALNPINTLYTEFIASIAFLLLLVSLVARFRIRTIVINDKVVSLGKFLAKQPNKAIVLITLLAIYTLYSAALVADIIPDIHSGNMPEGYYQLIEKADLGEDKGIDGKFEYQVYKEHLENFYKNRGLHD